jgi:hypothetical protein
MSCACQPSPSATEIASRPERDTRGRHGRERDDPFLPHAERLGLVDVVSVSVIIRADKAEAENVHQSAIDINNYPEIEGRGDRAYNAQSISDVTVLVGRYQLGVDVPGPRTNWRSPGTSRKPR